MEWRARVQADLLAHGRVPIEAVEVVGSADPRGGGLVEELLGKRGDRIRVEVQRDWYIQ